MQSSRFEPQYHRSILPLPVCLATLGSSLPKDQSQHIKTSYVRRHFPDTVTENTEGLKRYDSSNSQGWILVAPMWETPRRVCGVCKCHPYRWLSLSAILRVGKKAAEDWGCFGNQCGRPQWTKLPSMELLERAEGRQWLSQQN